ARAPASPASRDRAPAGWAGSALRRAPPPTARGGRPPPPPPHAAPRGASPAHRRVLALRADAPRAPPSPGGRPRLGGPGLRPQPAQRQQHLVVGVGVALDVHRALLRVRDRSPRGAPDVRA